MLTLIKSNIQTSTPTICIKDENTEFNMFYGGVLDYFIEMTDYDKIDINDSLEENNVPIVLKIPVEDELYSIFDRAYEDIKNTNIFVPEDEINGLENGQQGNDSNYEYERLNLECLYRQPFEGKEVVWKCDDFPENEGDIFKMSKTEDAILLEMYATYPYSSFGHIRIRTCGSRYGDYFLVFARLYEELKQYEPSKQKLFKR